METNPRRIVLQSQDVNEDKIEAIVDVSGSGAGNFMPEFITYADKVYRSTGIIFWGAPVYQSMTSSKARVSQKEWDALKGPNE